MNKWDARFMQMVDLVGTWASCYQDNRKMGAVIVKNNRVLTTGYNGAPAGIKTCVERGECLRRKLNIPSGTRGEVCYAIHAEQNAIIQAAKLGISIDGATMYCTHRACSMCARMMINAGIVRSVYRYDYPDDFTTALFRDAGMNEERFEG